GDPCVAAIGAAARDLVEKRDRWLNPPTDDERPTNDESGADQHSSSVLRPSSLKDRTLTKLYNERPTWLDMAHTKLNRAVLDAYGWPHEIDDQEILARLLALNLERAAGPGSTPAPQAAAADEEMS
ncbi:MAG: class I SAM-dependent DNA methyltransferase, partial [Roseiflexaceae bacterium]